MKKVFIIVLLAIILVVVAIYKLNVDNNYIYKITYKDEFIPGATYTFYIDKNYKVKAVKETYCSTMNCIETGNTSTEEKYDVNISDENQELFKVFVIKLFSGGKNEIELSSLTINENDEQIMRVLKYNNEKFFEYYKKTY